MENKKPHFGRSGKRLATGVAASTFLLITLSDGKVVKPFDLPDDDGCAIEQRCDVPALRQGYEVTILDFHDRTSTGTPYSYVVDMGIDDDGLFYKV